MIDKDKWLTVKCIDGKVMSRKISTIDGLKIYKRIDDICILSIVVGDAVGSYQITPKSYQTVYDMLLGDNNRKFKPPIGEIPTFADCEACTVGGAYPTRQHARCSGICTWNAK